MNDNLQVITALISTQRRRTHSSEAKHELQSIENRTETLRWYTISSIRLVSSLVSTWPHIWPSLVGTAQVSSRGDRHYSAEHRVGSSVLITPLLLVEV
ncbi:hypothetical protein IFT91_24680 [Pseudomonas fluorescens]|nr:hypothetical protein [Pseudomonas fluorescens]